MGVTEADIKAVFGNQELTYRIFRASNDVKRLTEELEFQKRNPELKEYINLYYLALNLCSNGLKDSPEMNDVLSKMLDICKTSELARTFNATSEKLNAAKNELNSLKTESLGLGEPTGEGRK